MNDAEFTSRSDDFRRIADAVFERLAKNERVRRSLPGEGRLRIDRQLPFLCVYRSPPGDDAGTQELVTSEAAYLFASGEEQYLDGLNELCQRVNAAMREHFGTFLFLEIWARDDEADSTDGSSLLRPGFQIVAPEARSLPGTIDAFIEALSEIAIHGQTADVDVETRDRVVPPGLPPLIHTEPGSDAAGCVVLGLAVRPVYRDASGGTLYPLVLQRLRTQLAWALRKAIAEFTGFDSPTGGDGHFESLGPTALVEAARIVDQQLCEVSEAFDFLLQVTPTNSDGAWEEFRRGGFRAEPTFYYRPLPYRPSLLKRRLFDIEIERIEDPTLAHLFWEKQEEIDRQLSALRDLNTPHFLYGSLQLYGEADDGLLKLAKDVFERFPSRRDGDAGSVNVADVVARARDEIDHYHQRVPEFNATVDVCDDIVAGIMVSHDRLLLASSLQLPANQLGPLLHHEIGTHLVTYFNGRCQPFRQLYAGLAGYEELQEGLAVMAEYLTGGLTVRRLRTLAGRVIAVRSMTDGDSFVETFERLRDGHGFSERHAFVTTLRAYRGGGLTKDVIYLRGLRNVLEYLGNGHDVEPLYVGKIGLHHVPYVQEMRRRGVIDAPRILPRFWKSEELRDRLEACRGRSVVQLLEDHA